MTTRIKARWLFGAAVVLIATPYLLVFGLGSLWIWQHGFVWQFALGLGLPTMLGFTLLEWARRLVFPRTVTVSRPPSALTPAGQAATQAVREISERLQAENLPLDQPGVLEKVAYDAISEVLETVAQHFHPQAERPVLQVPVAHIAAVVELVAHDFRLAFTEKVPWGHTVTPQRLLWWKKKGQLGWQLGTYLWQINRVRRLCMHPATAIVQELQDHLGQNMASQSMDGLKQWAIDFCVTKAGAYAIQLYSGGFVLSEEYRPRLSAEIESMPFEQEPLQILVMGQVKSGKSSLINALLGEMRAPVDTLPATDAVDLYECQPEGLPCLILRDTPGYGAVGDRGDAFSRLYNEIEECDLLLIVCNARSAARKADCDLLYKFNEFYRDDPKRIKPPVICLLTHVDLVPEHLATEAADAVAADLGMEKVVTCCTQWGRLANVEGVVVALREKELDAERLKVARCIRQIRQEQDEDKIVRQIVGGLRLTGGWIARKK
jgi:uncharacterized protein